MIIVKCENEIIVFDSACSDLIFAMNNIIEWTNTTHGAVSTDSSITV